MRRPRLPKIKWTERRVIATILGFATLIIVINNESEEVIAATMAILAIMTGIYIIVDLSLIHI